MQLLLDRGARVDRPGSAGRKHSLVFACLANGQPQAARFLAQRGAPLDLETAAGVGDLDFVKTFFEANGQLKPSATKEQLQSGLIWACGSGHNEVIEFPLAHGGDVDDAAGLHEPPLHMAVVGGHLATVKLLLARHAQTEQLNSFEGTALGQAVWSFAHGDPDCDYIPIFEALLAAGAKVKDHWLPFIASATTRSAEDKQRVSERLRKYGAT